MLHPDDRTAITALEGAAAGRRATVGIVVAGTRAGELVDAEQVAPEAAASVSADGIARETGEILVVGAVPPPRLLILGAGEHAAALCRVASAVGFAVTVCDVWELLVTPERFPEAVELVVDAPHEYLRSLGEDDIDARTAVCVLTHDVRLDVPALREALRMPVGFVGAMGARSTVARRADLLRTAGVDEASLARLRSPLGLDLGGASPAETALAALAEITAVRHGGSGLPLRERTGRLHPAGAAAVRAAAPGAEAAAPAASAVPTASVSAPSCAIG
ncbi:XdhC family protein [Microbacterium sp. SORGH_AS_0888]|uniref:XdhC family protein n=1 Tax=Microbacterium sp. SORGH_AS_0888 TaxID=3041791 RepID=UPI0027865422|nr:XdhC family protein [Microbacterium sp. SORGH_AS_0888]MDQ1129858.1 xanthine dehydrogenase accessory factor [Microbacterium sp. SORGH_AS_0888]